MKGSDSKTNNTPKVFQYFKSLTLNEFINTNKYRRSRRKDTKLQSVEKYLNENGMSLQTTVETLARYILSNCKKAHLHNTEFKRRGYNSSSTSNDAMVRTRRFNKKQETKSLNFLMNWMSQILRNSRKQIGSKFTME